MPNMKTLIVLIFLSNSVFGQFSLEREPGHKYSLGVFGNVFYYGMYTGIEAGLYQEKHAFNLGIGVNPFRAPYSTMKNWGANINYNYFPNGHRNRFDLFFDGNIILGLLIYDSDFEFV